MRRAAILATFSFVLLAVVGVRSASAATPAWCHVTALASPTYLPPGGQGRINVGVSDIGDLGVSGASVPITIAESLPAGLEPTAISGSHEVFTEREGVTCSLERLSCVFGESYFAFEHFEISITVRIKAGAR